MKKYFIAVLLFLGLTSLTTSQAKAASKAAANTFAIQAVIPENQANTKLAYFDLNMKPNQKQDLEVKVINSGTEKKNVTLNINNATTSDSGAIIYTETEKDLHNPNAISLASLVQGKREKKVTLKPGEVKSVKFTIKMPATTYDGIILGGITAVGDAGTSKDQSVTIQNKVRYVSGVVLHESDKVLTPRITLDKVTPKILQNMKGLGLKITNDEAINASAGTLEATLYTGDPEVKVSDYKQTKISIAPYSTFTYFLPEDKLNAGDYRLKGSYTTPDGYTKEFVQRFTVTAAQLKKIEPIDYTKQANKTGNQWYLIVAALAFILLVVLLILNYTVGFNRKRIDKRSSSSEHHYSDDDHPVELTPAEKRNLEKFEQQQSKAKEKATKKREKADKSARKRKRK